MVWNIFFGDATVNDILKAGIDGSLFLLATQLDVDMHRTREARSIAAQQEHIQLQMDAGKNVPGYNKFKILDELVLEKNENEYILLGRNHNNACDQKQYKLYQMQFDASSIEPKNENKFWVLISGCITGPTETTYIPKSYVLGQLDKSKLKVEVVGLPEKVYTFFE